MTRVVVLGAGFAFRMSLFGLRTGFYPIEAMVRFARTPPLALSAAIAPPALPEPTRRN
jgi:hypothetical protein